MYGTSKCTTANVNNNHNPKLNSAQQQMLTTTTQNWKTEHINNTCAEKSKFKMVWRQYALSRTRSQRDKKLTSENYKLIYTYIKGKGLRVCPLHCCLQLSLAQIYIRTLHFNPFKILQIKNDNHTS
jgi:hypothetical protein